MFVDTHCHPHFEQFAEDRPEVLRRAEGSLSALIAVGTDVGTSREANALAQQHRFIYSSVGFHPHEAASFSEALWSDLRECAKATKVVAIGEIGLDYYRMLSPKEDQQKAFVRCLDLAEEFRMPVILHIRDAYEDALSLLKDHFKGPLRGVNHCFSGTTKELEQMLDLGLYISFAGNVTYPNAESLREAAKTCPLERLLLETDAPYLAPQASRGKRNEPSFLTETARVLSGLLQMTPDHLGEVTQKNALRLFPMGLPERERQLVYPIQDSLYINVTNACSARCTFCELSEPASELYLKGYRLRMRGDPSSQEVLEAIGDPTTYQEVVFCGYGEPTLRLSFIVEVARILRQKGAKVIRLNTNGHGNLIHRRSIVPDLVGLIDEVSVSLDAENEENYNRVVRPHFGVGTYGKVKEFILECKSALPKVVATFVEVPEIDPEACRRVAQALGVEAKIRKLDVVG